MPRRQPNGDAVSLDAAVLSTGRGPVRRPDVGERFGRRLPSKNAAAAKGMREPPLLGDQIRQGRSGRASFDPPGLVVEPLDRSEDVVPPEPGLLHRRLHDVDRLVIDPERDREGMAVLAAMGERKARRIGETVRRAVNDFGHHRQRAHRPRADARHEQQFGKVGWSPIARPP